MTHKRYRVRRRAHDGRTIYRWGFLTSAEVIQLSDDPSDVIVVFVPGNVGGCSGDKA